MSAPTTLLGTLSAFTDRALSSLRSYAAVVLLIAVVFGIAMGVTAWSEQYGIAPAVLFRDANAVSDAPHYYGLFSQAGLMIWAGAAGSLLLALVSGLLTPPDRRYVAYSLVFTIILLLDDGFQLHENYSPHYKSVDYLHLLYVAMIGLYFVLFRGQLLRSPLILLLLALLFFGGSLAFDAVPDRGALVPEYLIYYIEDGFKLFGLCFWSAFYVLDCRRLLRSAVANR